MAPGPRFRSTRFNLKPAEPSVVTGRSARASDRTLHVSRFTLPSIAMENTNNQVAISLRGMVYVHLIESPSPQDLLDGRTEGAVLRESLDLAAIPNSYNLATDRATFETAITDKIHSAMAAFDAHPLLHFSMHGSQDGLGLTSGDIITWSKLASHIRATAPLAGCGLIVCMSSCYGAFARRMAFTHESAPYFLLFGHPGDLDWVDAAVGFTALYHRLFKGVPSLEAAVNAMREASGDNRFDLSYSPRDQAAWRQHTHDLARSSEK